MICTLVFLSFSAVLFLKRLVIIYPPSMSRSDTKIPGFSQLSQIRFRSVLGPSNLIVKWGGISTEKVLAKYHLRLRTSGLIA